jgi:transcriptional regulator with XRE-family HTH domain
MSSIRKIWTKKGLLKLGGIIRQSREARGLTLREFADLSSTQGNSVHFKTISCIENSSVMPNFNTLEAIASSGLVFSKGKALDIYDFIDIASETDNDNGVSYTDLPLLNNLNHESRKTD